MNALRNAISAITKEKGNTFINEHEVLLELKQELTDYEEDLGKRVGDSVEGISIVFFPAGLPVE